MPVETRMFRVVRRISLTFNTFSLTLEPDDGKLLFPFSPGQWVGVKVPHDPIPHRRNVAYSIASAPIESTREMELAIKVCGNFSRLMEALMPNDRLLLQGPFGIFTLRPGRDRVVCFAGGIGITPLRSMIREILLSNDPREVVLFYSSRASEGIPYGEEFQNLADIYPNFRVLCMMTGTPQDAAQPSRAPIHCECGRIDAACLNRFLPDVTHSEFYLCGPRPFMETVTSLLLERGVEMRTRLHRELFG